MGSNMELVQKGLVFGIITGILDSFFIIFQNISVSASIYIFLICIIAGVFIATSESKIHGAWRGLGITTLLLAPSILFLVAEIPFYSISMIILTLVLGTLMGHYIDASKKVEYKFLSEKTPKEKDFKTAAFRGTETVLFKKRK